MGHITQGPFMRRILFLMCIHLFQSCSHATPKKELNYIANGAYYTILQFPVGSIELNENSKNELKAFYIKALEKTNKSPDLKNVHILVWPDQQKNKIQNEFILINKRALAVQNYFIENLNAKAKYSISNMLVEPNRIDELIKSDDKKHKKVFEKTEPISSSHDEDLANLIENKASKVLIMVNYE